MKTSFTIHDLPDSERPRERLEKHGVHSLSVQELLMLILGRGIKGESVMITAQRLLKSFGTVDGIARASLEELAAVKGLGLAKACQIQAVFELAGRKGPVGQFRQKIKSATDIVPVVAPSLKHKKKEHFLVACLDTGRKIIKTCEISMGTVDTNIVHPREVFKEAIQALSSSIILVHNHPAGNPEPSNEDIKVTKKLYDSGKLLGINVLDHIIIAGERYLSFKEEGIVF
ncbi:DNA repair protein RadC [Candidatus Margulisiibacteriota bacterium]